MIDREFAVQLVEAQLERESPGQVRVTQVEEHELAWIASSALGRARARAATERLRDQRAGGSPRPHT